MADPTWDEGELDRWFEDVVGGDGRLASLHESGFFKGEDGDPYLARIAEMLFDRPYTPEGPMGLGWDWVNLTQEEKQRFRVRWERLFPPDGSDDSIVPELTPIVTGIPGGPDPEPIDPPDAGSAEVATEDLPGLDGIYGSDPEPAAGPEAEQGPDGASDVGDAPHAPAIDEPALDAWWERASAAEHGPTDLHLADFLAFRSGKPWVEHSDAVGDDLWEYGFRRMAPENKQAFRDAWEAWRVAGKAPGDAFRDWLTTGQPPGGTPASSGPPASTAPRGMNLLSVPLWQLVLGAAAIIALVGFAISMVGGDSDETPISGGVEATTASTDFVAVAPSPSSLGPTTTVALSACDAARADPQELAVSSPEFTDVHPSTYTHGQAYESGFATPPLAWSALPEATTEVAIIIQLVPASRVAEYASAEDPLSFGGGASTRWIAARLDPADVPTGIGQTSLATPLSSFSSGAIEVDHGTVGVQVDGEPRSNKFAGGWTGDGLLIGVFALCDTEDLELSRYFSSYLAQEAIASGWMIATAP